VVGRAEPDGLRPSSSLCSNQFPICVSMYNRQPATCVTSNGLRRDEKFVNGGGWMFQGELFRLVDRTEEPDRGRVARTVAILRAVMASRSKSFTAN
jgi:hypothetical protein